MIVTQQEKERLEEKLSEGWLLSPELFGDVGADIHDFFIGNYVYFLNNVNSLDKLLEGLRQLSPLADDALKVASRINREEFDYFKINIPNYRKGLRGNHKYRRLLIPERFLEVSLSEIPEKCQVPDGTALIRMMEWGVEK